MEKYFLKSVGTLLNVSASCSLHGEVVNVPDFLYKP